MNTLARTLTPRSKTIWLNIGIATLLAGCADMAAQPGQPITPAHDLVMIPGNDEVVSGTLANGFQYHIDTWAQGARTVEFRLKVDVGSLDEAEDEKGYAHFIEHMAFNGTQQYPGNSLIDYLKSTGMDFGGDINAHTYYNQTVYQLSVPSDQRDLVLEAYTVLSEWAQGIEFDPAEVEAEKGVILEEWRLQEAGKTPVWLQQYQSFYAGSDYLDHRPIGTPESIQTATAEQLRNLYQRTYRADRMTLYVSGDLDLGDTQYRIHKHFAGLPKSDDFVPNRPEVDYGPARFSVSSDETVANSYLEIARVFRPEPLTTVTGQQQELYTELLAQALEERGKQWSRQQSPVVDTEIYVYEMEDGAFVIDLTLGAEGRLQPSHAEAGERIWQQLIQHGISADEYQLYGRRLIDDLRIQGDTMADYSAAERLDWIKYVTESGLDLFDWDAYIQAARQLHGYYNHRDFNSWLAAEVAEAPVLGAAVLTHAEFDSWSESQLAKAITSMASRSVAAMDVQVEEAADVSLNRRPGEVIAVEETEVPGLKRITLGNGLVVWFYPSDLEANNVIVNLVSRGGTAARSRENAVLDLFWANVLMESPPAGLSRSGYEDWQAARGIEGSVYSFTTSSGLYWTGRPDNLDSMLAMIAHQMQPMELDSQVVNEYLAGIRDYLAALPNTPDGRTEAALRPYVIDHPGFSSIIPGDLGGVTIETLNQYQSQWLSQGTGLDLFVVGNVREKALTEALAKNLAGVPLPHPSTGSVDPDVWQGSQRIAVAAHEEQRTDIDMRVRLAEPVWDQRQRLVARLASAMLEDYLFNEIREVQGDSYDIQVGVDQAEPTVPATIMMISTSTSPERANAVLGSIDKAMQSPEVWLTDTRLNTIKRQERESNRRMRRNLYDILDDIEFFTRSDRELADYNRADKMLDSVGLKDIDRFMADVNRAEDRLIVTLEPRG